MNVEGKNSSFQLLLEMHLLGKFENNSLLQRQQETLS